MNLLLLLLELQQRVTLVINWADRGQLTSELEILIDMELILVRLWLLSVHQRSCCIE